MPLFDTFVHQHAVLQSQLNLHQTFTVPNLTLPLNY